MISDYIFLEFNIKVQSPLPFVEIMPLKSFLTKRKKRYPVSVNNKETLSTL